MSSPLAKRMVGSTDSQGIRAQIDGSKSPDTTWDDWFAYRRFLADEIIRDGPILDVGCANGFLLLCLREWSGRALDPYGIDVDGEAIAGARELFSDARDHFAVCDARAVERLPEIGFPVRYAHILWNVWSAWDAESTATVGLAQALLRLAPAGRLIAAFYGVSEYRLGSPAQRQERAAVMSRAGSFRAGLRSGIVVTNPTGGSQVLVVVEGC